MFSDSFLAFAALEQTCSPSCNETHFLTSRRSTRNCCGMADVLVITSAVRVLHGVHRGTAHLWPRVALHTVFMEIITSLEHWFVHSSTTRNDSHDSTAC